MGISDTGIIGLCKGFAIFSNWLCSSIDQVQLWQDGVLKR